MILHLLRLILVILVLLISGCTQPVSPTLSSCPGAGQTENALKLLRANTSLLPSFRINGRCKAIFYDEEKRYEENFNIKLWVNPPSQIRLQGDIFLDPKGIVLGSNEEEFWFSIKPQLSTYLWGKWSEQDSPTVSLISPSTLLEALGSVQLGDNRQWQLSNDGIFDVLTQTDSNNRVIKKIYIYCCDYLIRRIEYYNNRTSPVLTVWLDDYHSMKTGTKIPLSVKLSMLDENSRENSFSMTFNKPHLYEFTDDRAGIIFTRPEPRSFKSIYRIIHGKAVEQ